jgi:protein-S-isoprenylcysteine O-methyltransferase Ste14
MSVPSWLLVALQLALMGALLVTVWPPADDASPIVAVLLFGAGAIVGLAALRQNRLGNFSIRPEPKAGARLATRGIYRWIRHPMYCAVLLAMAGALAPDPRLWRVLLWLALLAVLIVKLRREEFYLQQRFPDYAAYRERTWRLLPGLW